MTKSRFLPSLVLVAAVLAACAPATSTVAPAQPPAAEPTATLPPAESLAQATPIQTEASAPTVVPVATSRGPDLHATDPATVSLASGGLQLVEFFRFT